MLCTLMHVGINVNGLYTRQWVVYTLMEGKHVNEWYTRYWVVYTLMGGIHVNELYTH